MASAPRRRDSRRTGRLREPTGPYCGNSLRERLTMAFAGTRIETAIVANAGLVAGQERGNQVVPQR